MYTYVRMYMYELRVYIYCELQKQLVMSAHLCSIISLALCVRLTDKSYFIEC